MTLTLPAELKRAPKSPTFRFWVGYGTALATGAGSLIDRLSADELDNVVAAIWAGWRVADPAIKDLRQRVQNALSRNAKKVLKQYEQPSCGKGHWTAYRRAELHRADLIGLVISRDPGAGLAAIAKSEGKSLEHALAERRYRKLLKFALSSSYTKLAKQLWGSG